MKKTFLCITIDTEPDCTVKWNRSKPLTFDNIYTGIAKILHPLFQQYSVKPTYLISPEVLNDSRSVEVLKQLNGCELGTHLHTEYIEPDIKHTDPAGTRSSTFPCNLPDKTEYEKLVAITELFEKCFGYRPNSYRAARFGADENSFLNLEKLGYKVDTSVTPCINWKSKGGPDFSNYPRQPYWIMENKLLEIPVTIEDKRFFLFPNKWFCYKWLRPSIMTTFEMKKLIKNVMKKYEQFSLLNIMFHSMEIIPNASPYVRTKKGQKIFLKKLKNIFEYAKKNNVKSKTLTEVYNDWL